MSEITPDILAKIAPSTSHALRDRFIPFLNDACPRYGITSKLRVAAFLTTTAFESAYFRATKEGKAKAGTKAGNAQAKYWATGFYGRGLIQTTHREGYQAVGEYLESNGTVDDANLFVDHPELLEEPKWAVESACVFWTQNGLNRYADSGKIFAIEGIVNRGNPAKAAWGEAERESLYKNVLSILPDDFDLASVAAGPQADSTSAVNSAQPASTTADAPTVQPPPIESADSPAKPSVWERLTDWKGHLDTLSGVKDSLLPASTSPIGGASRFVVIQTKLMGWGTLMAGFWRGHWYEVLAGVVLIGLAIWYLEKRKTANGPNPAPTAVASTTVVT